MGFATLMVSVILNHGHQTTRTLLKGETGDSWMGLKLLRNDLLVCKDATFFLRSLSSLKCHFHQQSLRFRVVL